jgi:hypothetical protein
MSAAAIPYWVLISVLMSTQPLDEGLALELHRIAFQLYRTGTSTGKLQRELESGEVRNLRQDIAVGSLQGPLFEAELETSRGKGLTRFVLTRAGLEHLAHLPRPVADHELN